MSPHLSVVPEGTDKAHIEARADRIRRLQDEAARSATEGINGALDAAEGLVRELIAYSGDDMKVVPAGIRDALKKLAAEIDGRVVTIRQIGARA